MTAKIIGYNKEPGRAIEQGGRYNMEYGIVRGKQTIKKQIRTTNYKS